MEKTLPGLVMLLFAFGIITTDSSLFQLQKMIKKVTGESAIPHYSTYGCHCGLGGKGDPLDQTDWCCRYHDCCYDKMVKQGCKPKSLRYSYTDLSGNLKCDGRTSCQEQVCECDRNFVLCLKENLRSYKSRHRFYWNYFCSGSTPRC